MTDYFYFALTPTADLPIYYTNCFAISYIDDEDLRAQQHENEIDFRNFIGGPSNYNGQWSNAYSDFESASNERESEITALRNAGKTVLTPKWPNLSEELETIPEASNNELSLEIGPLINSQRDAIEASLTKRFTAFAGANTWGPWVQIAIYLGKKNFIIRYKSLENAQVYGAVKYLGASGPVLQKFKNAISFKTGDKWGVVYVCFFGIQNSSVVQGLLDYEI